MASTDSDKERPLTAGVFDPAPAAIDHRDGDVLRQMAEQAVQRLLDIDPADAEEKQQGVAAVEQMAAAVQQKAARRSMMLKQSVHALAGTGDDGGPVASALLELRTTVESLDPERFDFSNNGIRRLLAWLPFIGTPLNRYFARYQSAEAVLSDIVRSLEAGRDQLKRDILTLDDDQQQMRELIEALEAVLAYARLIDDLLTERLDNELVSDDPRAGFIREEIVFPLRQRIMDLQQQLNVSQQAVLTMDIIRRNDQELIRGVSRALNVTISALQVAVALSLALVNQKIVLDKIEAVNSATDSLIAQTAENLKTQGVAIHKQAASAQLSMDALKRSFADIEEALTDIATFRREALPEMAQSILEMDRMTEAAAAAIRDVDEGQRLQAAYGLELFAEAGDETNRRS